MDREAPDHAPGDRIEAPAPAHPAPGRRAGKKEAIERRPAAKVAEEPVIDLRLRPGPVDALAEAEGPVDALAAEDETEADRELARELEREQPAAARLNRKERREAARAALPALLAQVKAQAQARAQIPRSLDPKSKFMQRLEGHYLADYLAAPSKDAGRAANEKVGKQFTGPATGGDYWEKGALAHWNKAPIPAGFRSLRPNLPEDGGAATDVMSRSNRSELPYIDSPHLLGKNNAAVEEDADVAGGGKNISQLMHWATGTRHADVDRTTMRELFLAYELFHLEGWDVFGEDALNDLIAEDAGHTMGQQLAAGELDRGNLHGKLDAGFAESRAWVGTLLRERQGVLDQWITSEDLNATSTTNTWWGAGQRINVWGYSNLFTELSHGQTIAEVLTGELGQRIIDIYSLIYEADAWEKANGTITNSKLITGMARGDLDGLFAKLANKQTPGLGELSNVMKLASQ